MDNVISVTIVIIIVGVIVSIIAVRNFLLWSEIKRVKVVHP